MWWWSIPAGRFSVFSRWGRVGRASLLIAFVGGGGPSVITCYRPGGFGLGPCFGVSWIPLPFDSWDSGLALFAVEVGQSLGALPRFLFEQALAQGPLSFCLLVNK